jgi:hypothetical protein
MYPYENEEYDSEEAALNSQIKVRARHLPNLHRARVFRERKLYTNALFFAVHHPIRRRRQ